MINYPVTIVDNFLDDPEALRKYALGLDYKPESKDSDYPGLRSDRLDLINLELFRKIGNKIVRLFYFTNNKAILWNWVADAYFQKVGLDNGNLGWVHRDRDICLTAIVYLNPDLTVGTTIFKKIDTLEDSMKTFCNNRINLTTNELDRKLYNEKYQETIKVSGLYNRLLTFEGTCYHAPQDYVPNSADDFRLTLIYYFKHIIVNYDGYIQSPLTRMYTGESFDSI